MENDYLKDVSILVVDDQEFIRNLVREMLRVLGAEHIYDALEGEDAWDQVNTRQIDMVLTDWYMKPVDGVALTHRIRNDPQSPNPYMPIIMMSGFSERARIFGARDSGINEFVVKPLSAKALFGRIMNVIEHPRQFVRTEQFFGPDRRRKKQEVDDERRGQGAKPEPEKAPLDMTQEMSQDEVDAFLNPDSVPKE
ncbi:MAG: response regulator [Rhodospirillaceae bacterium]|nr:response regulator [Rhodospirillaceae bacterium]